MSQNKISGKRKNNDDKKLSHPKKNSESNAKVDLEENAIDGLVFDDPFEDEFEEEEYDAANEDDDDEYEDIDGESEQIAMEIDNNNNNNKKMNKSKNEKKPKVSASSVQTPTPSIQKDVWRPGVDKLEEDEELEYDPSAYVMYHSIQTEWPCLSFDFIQDDFGNNRQRFPLSMLLVTGSQADHRDRNKVTLLKLSDVHKTKVNLEDDDDEDDDNDDEDDDDLDDDPVIEDMSVPHVGGVNRIRSMPQMPGVIATMSDTKFTHIYDMTLATKALMSSNAPRVKPNEKPSFTFKGHKDEGFALDWSHVTTGW